MNKFGGLYSQYYDLLYQDKDYVGEVDYIDDLIREFGKNSKTILDMGCGTGKHAGLLCDKGYIVHGIDISKDMLEVAQQRRKGREDKLKFTHSNIQALNLGKKFDVVVSLFHVMSYQNETKDLIKAFEVAKSHLTKGGIFVFDFWYGPAVLTDLPVTRIKQLENENIEVTRLVQPEMHSQENIVNVNYDIFIENKKTKEIIKKKELHKMRYFFDTELDMICNQVGFKIERKYKWMKHTDTPSFNSWNVVWIVKS